ncbi:MAG: amidohydrolase family protein [Methylomonas sp.]|jgi:cytosine/adenosine deaminase-related metal-dependent hydrolase|uniref:amidohydrolase family protein n=1 Tax=Methylomonas sp. TaxID=418 RepID=UPI0025E7A234|nr:amidohydrolase family protein [Methylomonas sp.]MCK9607924.1 amidohydrolase family protein [Methylomonas sp.]
MKLTLRLLNGLTWLCCAAVPLSSYSAFADSYVIHAARVFDGYSIRTDAVVLVADDKIVKIDSPEAFTHRGFARIELGDATVLPGFIELHAHLSFRQVPAEVVLRHGITTLRDVGGPLHAPYGGNGSLRVMTSGPIITAPNGYPIPGLGEHNIAIPVATETQARETVRALVAGGAVVIKVALEPGGEAGAPWSKTHVHAGQHLHTESQHQPASTSQNWPLLSLSMVKAIVDEAHALGRIVSTHIAETTGTQIALDAGIDEWAHAPCTALPDAQLRQAVQQKVKVVATIDTLSKCAGIFSNVERLAAMGAELYYGAEIAHADIPWGIDAQELLYLRQAAGMTSLEVLQTATAKAGAYLNIPLLGTLLPGAPADLIAVSGDPLQSLKLLEYPDLVISGGKIVVNHFTQTER